MNYDNCASCEGHCLEGDDLFVLSCGTWHAECWEQDYPGEDPYEYDEKVDALFNEICSHFEGRAA